MTLNRYFRPEPLPNLIARDDLVRRLRLFWQRLVLTREAPAVAPTLALTMAGLGLTEAEQEEVLGSGATHSFITGDSHHD